METEVTSCIKDESQNLKSSIVQPTISDECSNKKKIVLQNNESSEAPSNGTINKNKLGASPKLSPEQNTSYYTQKKTEINCEEDTAPADCQYFFEDEIFRIDKKGRVKFGLVVETPGTYSGDEDDEFNEILGKGEIRAMWYPEFKESVQSENSIGLADRILMPGDVVRRLVPGKETQKGYCRDMNMKADVKVMGTKYVIKNVNAERLKAISNWRTGGTVCLDSWVGCTRDVEEKAILRTASGCRIEISSNNFFNFRDLTSFRQHDILNPKVFYPGNTIVGCLPSMEEIKVLTPNIPLHTNKRGKPLSRKFIIESIDTECVWVNWQCKSLSDDANAEDITLQPNPFVRGEDLKRLKFLNLFESCMLQIVDRSYLTYSTCDTLVKKTDWDREQEVKFKEIFRKQKEEYQKIFVRTSFTGAVGTTGSHHNNEKLKKKLSLSLEEKGNNKIKRILFKGENFGKREVSQEMITNEKPSLKINNDGESEWFSTEDEAEFDDDECDINTIDIDNFVGNIKKYSEDCVSTTTTISTCSSPSPHTSPKHLTRHQLKKKARKAFKKPFLVEPSTEFIPKEGDEIVTEALLVYSTATVVWQDGTIESDIPSTQLYPIHHLDNHEFFPGDFVVSAKDDKNCSHRDYGVIQTVDHEGRIAHVKWFSTYTSTDEPKPTYKGESECSVYDLKDQPDFQYRPGTMVIRVANFVGEDAKCTAGQVIHNYIDGRVKVWWVDGHISLCWPQDLFEVGQLDQGDLSNASDDSWETESENSEIGCNSGINNKTLAESNILTNIEKALESLARLQEIFNINPNLQNPEIIRKLLAVYKSSRFLDRLLNTNFFHEEHFVDLIERVRKVSVQEHAQDQKSRIFCDDLQATSSSTTMHQQQQHQCSEVVLSTQGENNINGVAGIGATASVYRCHQSLSLGNSAKSPKEFAPRVLFTISSTPFKCHNNHNHNNNNFSSQLPTPPSYKKRSFPVSAENGIREFSIKKTDDLPTASTCASTTKEESDHTKTNVLGKPSYTPNNIFNQKEISPSKTNQYNVEKYLFLNSFKMNIERAFEKTSFFTSTSQEDSGNYSNNKHYDCSSTSYTSSSDIETSNSLTNANDNQNTIIQSRSGVDLATGLECLRLCSLLKKQLVKFLNEICDKYCKDYPHNWNDIYKIDLNCDDTAGTVIDNESNEVTVASSKNNENIRTEEVVEDSTTFGKSSALMSEIGATTVETAVAEYSSTKDNSHNVVNIVEDSFQILPNAPKNHKYQLTNFHPYNPQQYYKAVQREHRLLKTSLPPGVHVKVYEDRMDLLSVMIEGPKHTPYQDGLFFFDIQLGRDYPKTPPLCHYISYCSDRLNPNLYEDGKVCVSLLGTWMGKGTEMWRLNSTLLQVIVSIQGLILVPEPYFNEAGYEKQKGTQQGRENSRMYNEMVIIKMIQSSTKLIQNPPEIFRNEITNHFKQNGLNMYERVKDWMELSQQAHLNTEEDLTCKDESIKNVKPKNSLLDFPLIPASRGFCLTLAGLLENFQKSLKILNEITAPQMETTKNQIL